MGRQRIQLFQTNNGSCPYRESGVWENLSFYTRRLSDEAYASLLDQGFRRSGNSVYHPICQNCESCIPIRVDVNRFAPSKSQRRTWRRNQDLQVVSGDTEFSEAAYDLYRRYQIGWHGSDAGLEEADFHEFLVSSPVSTEMLHYYLGDQLLGVGWVDRLPQMLSSVYFIFDPEFASRRLGVFSLLCEIEYCRRLGLPWLYLGYWVPDSQKMGYKAEYRPAEVLVRGQWRLLSHLPKTTKHACA